MKISLKISIIFLLIVAFSSVATAQELTLYTMPSPREINWSSPRTLLKSAVTNNITLKHWKKKHPIGHVFISLKNGKEVIFTGSVPTPEDDSSKKVLKQGYGLGILFTDMKGRLEDTQDLIEEIGPRFESGRIAYIRFKLSQKTYARLKTYLTKYRARGYGNNYNGLNKPREGLGAGCSIFGIAFLEVAGLMHPVWKKKWPINVRIPKKYIGGPLTGNKVSIWKVLRAKKWAKENQPHMKLELYEPYYIYQWILSEWRKEYTAKTGRVRLLKNKKAFGLEYDCRHVPTPTEPMFKGEAAEIED